LTAPRLLSNVRGSGQGQKTCKMHAHSGGRSTSTAGCQAGRCWRDWHSAVRTLPATRHARLLTDTRAEGRTAHPHLAHVHNHHSAPRGVSRAHRIQTKRMTKLTPTVNVIMPVGILSRAHSSSHRVKADPHNSGASHSDQVRASTGRAQLGSGGEAESQSQSQAASANTPTGCPPWAANPGCSGRQATHGEARMCSQECADRAGNLESTLDSPIGHDGGESGAVWRLPDCFPRGWSWGHRHFASLLFDRMSSVDDPLTV